MRAWDDVWLRTWLGDADIVLEFDRRVRVWLGDHRKLVSVGELESVAPVSVEQLANEVRVFGMERRWHWCSSAVCLLAELLFSAKRGGIFPSAAEIDPWSWDAQQNVEPLRLLRNALFHPARYAHSGGPRPIEALIEWLTANMEMPLSSQIAAHWSALALRPVTEFALRKLDAAGRAYGRQLGIAR